MDPTVAAAMGQLTLNSQQEELLRLGRQSDGAQEDNRMIGAGVFRLIAQASDPSTYADFNTSSHVPVPQPYIAPGYVSAPQPTASGS